MSDSDGDADDAAIGCKRSPSSEGSSTDLDFAGEGFKPLRVLYSRRTQPPVPRAKLHDNVGQFESKFKQLGGFGERYSEKRIRELQQASSSKAAPIQIPAGMAPVRRFLPHQEMIKGEKPARYRKNILTKVENYEGPLGELRKWMRERTRVKVYTRREKGVRGYLTGFVEVFDKHWNIALSDVFESWKRRKYRYSENKLCVLGEPGDCTEQLRKMGITVPKVDVKSDGTKYVICTRRVSKLMVRGEQVVLVTRSKDV